MKLTFTATGLAHLCAESRRMNGIGKANRVWLLILVAACVVSAAGTACASNLIRAGATAPDFTAPSVLAGKNESFHLADALKRGAVVLYFFPQAFSTG